MNKTVTPSIFKHQQMRIRKLDIYFSFFTYKFVLDKLHIVCLFLYLPEMSTFSEKILVSSFFFLILLIGNLLFNNYQGLT